MKITCMKGLNMHSPKSFKDIVNLMDPDVITCKAYAYMGFSKERMKKENTPNYDEVLEFSKKLSESLRNYEVASSKKGSDVVILRRTYPRIINNEYFIYEDLDKEKLRINNYLNYIRTKL